MDFETNHASAPPDQAGSHAIDADRLLRDTRRLLDGAPAQWRKLGIDTSRIANAYEKACTGVLDPALWKALFIHTTAPSARRNTNTPGISGLPGSRRNARDFV